MQKLVLCYNESDGCTYSCHVNEPFYYESKEKAEYDLLELWEKRKPYDDIKFANISIPYDALTYYEIDKLHKKRVPKYREPQIYTLEEWFETKLNG
jgi:hypothetical protein